MAVSGARDLLGALLGWVAYGWLGGHATLHVMGLTTPKWWRREARMLNTLQEQRSQNTDDALELIQLRKRLAIGREALTTGRRSLGQMKSELANIRLSLDDSEWEGSEQERADSEAQQSVLERAVKKLGAEATELDEQVSEVKESLKAMTEAHEELRPILNEQATFVLAVASTRNARRLVWATWALVLSTVTLAAPTLKSAGAAVADHWPW